MQAISATLPDRTRACRKDHTRVRHALYGWRRAAPRRVDDGSAITDYDEEEIARKMSIATGLALSSGQAGCQGQDQSAGYSRFNMFVHEAKMCCGGGRGAGGSGRRGGSGGGDAARLELLQRRRFARMIVVNRMDRDRADANRVLESLVNAFGRAVTPLQLPIGSGRVLAACRSGPHEAYTYEMVETARQGRSDSGEHGGRSQEAHEKLWSWWPRARTR